MNIEEYIQAFFHKVAIHSIDIYNEFSLQHELGLFLRDLVPKPYKVEFERNVKFFYPGAKCTKSEIDLVIYHPDQLDEKYAIELKFPKNGQYPETMFHFVKDILFMEQVKQLGFKKTFAVTYVNDKLFYQGDKMDGIYRYFRGSKILNGEIQKPTGKKDETLLIMGTYQISWIPLSNGSKYYIVNI
jgi:hypothetical protein